MTDPKAAYLEKLSLYRQKLSEADPTRDDSYNKHGALQYVVEALELTGGSMGFLTEDEFEVYQP